MDPMGSAKRHGIFTATLATLNRGFPGNAMIFLLAEEVISGKNFKPEPLKPAVAPLRKALGDKCAWNIYRTVKM